MQYSSILCTTRVHIIHESFVEHIFSILQFPMSTVILVYIFIYYKLVENFSFNLFQMEKYFKKKNAPEILFKI